MMGSKEKLCSVCGDKALGNNFNAITCESCKAFFRRNALSTKEFTCPFQGKCEVTIVTRRFCQKCRLEKCFNVGMRKECIMSEEDKIVKRRKIEQNRAKRKIQSHHQIGSEKSTKIKREFTHLNDYVETGTLSSKSPQNTIQSSDDFEQSDISHTTDSNDSQSSSAKCEPQTLLPTSNASAEDIVNQIVDYPEEAAKYINTLMRTPTEALSVMTKIINSQTDAMRLIGHLIKAPGDALKIISKIMNSPFDALTVFTKFMSSPTDALEIISKVASSPSEVLQFLQQLMNSPEDALNIMKKFMNSPAEALRMINKMVNHSNVDSTTSCENLDENLKIVSDDRKHELSQTCGTNRMIKSMLEPGQNDSPKLSSVSSPIRLNSPIDSIATSSFNLTHCDLTKGIFDSNGISKNDECYASQSDRMKIILQDVEDRSIQPNSIESVLCEAIKLEYEAYNSVSQTQTNNRELNETERAKLNELILACNALTEPIDEDVSGLEYGCSMQANNNQNPQLLKLINLTALAIRRLIKMSKKICAFRNMCTEDQVALLKGGCTEMMILHSVKQYDCDHAIWKIPHAQKEMSNIRANVLKLAKGNVYDEHDRFIRTFDPKWRQDENIVIIMCAIVLFTSTRPRTVHSDVIRLEQNSYYYLLRRYLESVYSGCEAKSIFLKLLQKISELQKLSDVIIGVYLDANPTQVEPLLREIFDIKNH